MTSKRLARLVRLKRLMERSHLSELQRRRAELESAEQQLQDTKERLHSAPTGSRESVADLEQEARYREHLAEQADVQRDTVTDCSEEVNSGEVKVRGAWTERRLFEHIHGRAALREAEDMRRQDWRANDAVALNSYARKQADQE